MGVFPPAATGLERLWYGQGNPSILWATLRLPLAAASVIFRFGVAVKNYCYRVGIFQPERIIGARVLSVGNLVAGGAGKTPAVIFLTQRLLGNGRRVAVISRGYGRQSRGEIVVEGEGAAAEQIGDEPSLIVQRCKGALVLVGRRKLKLAKRARELGAEFIIIDDGMQHRSLARDAEIVVIDGKVGFGNGHMLPWGPLREPTSSLARADLVWMNGQGAKVATPKVPMVSAEYRALSVRDSAGAEHSLGTLRAKAVFLLAAIARPERFSQMIAQLGAVIVGLRIFPDHHWFSDRELSEIQAEATQNSAVVVTTEKDATRLPPTFQAWSVRMESRIVAGQEHLDRMLGFS